MPYLYLQTKKVEICSGGGHGGADGGSSGYGGGADGGGSGYGSGAVGGGGVCV